MKLIDKLANQFVEQRARKIFDISRGSVSYRNAFFQEQERTFKAGFEAAIEMCVEVAVGKNIFLDQVGEMIVEMKAVGDKDE